MSEQPSAGQELTVRALSEAEWSEFKTVRLAALADAPEAFAATAEEEEAFDEDYWRARMRRSVRFVAERGEAPLGVVSLGDGKAEDHSVGEIFGLWVRPEARGTGVATALVRAGARRARQDGRSFVAYWVGTDNGPGVAFASGMGFRPTDFRRPMRVQSGDNDDNEEAAMVLPLGDDRGQILDL